MFATRQELSIYLIGLEKIIQNNIDYFIKQGTDIGLMNGYLGLRILEFGDVDSFVFRNEQEARVWSNETRVWRHPINNIQMLDGNYLREIMDSEPSDKKWINYQYILVDTEVYLDGKIIITRQSRLASSVKGPSRKVYVPGEKRRRAGGHGYSGFVSIK